MLTVHTKETYKIIISYLGGAGGGGGAGFRDDGKTMLKSMKYYKDYTKKAILFSVPTNVNPDGSPVIIFKCIIIFLLSSCSMILCFFALILILSLFLDYISIE